MANSLNRVTIIGNLGKDPEIRTFPMGGRVCNFSVAVSERWKSKDTGDYKERTEWINASILNENIITYIEGKLKKGDKVYLEGQIETRKWKDKEGVERYTTEVVLRQFKGELIMLSGKDAKSDTSGPDLVSAIPEGFNDSIPF